MALPSGQTVTRSTLQEHAQPLIALGAPAVPSLLRWAHDESQAVRYVALYALEQITGERPQISYFAKEADNDQLAQALSIWWRWYEANAG